MWSLPIARQDPEAKITFADYQEPVDVACRTAAAVGMEGRFATIIGDPFTSHFPKSQFNLAVVANLLHLIPVDQWKSLLGRIIEAIAPQGRLLIVDVFPWPRKWRHHTSCISTRPQHARSQCGLMRPVDATANPSSTWAPKNHSTPISTLHRTSTD